MIEPLPARPSARPNVEGVAEILTEGARRGIEHTGKTISNAAKAVLPALKKVADVARAHRDPSGGDEPERPVVPVGADDLRARFEVFTRKRAGKSRGD